MKRFAWLRVVALVVASMVTAATVVPGLEPETLGDKVVAFCKENLGQKVGNGQCGVLAGHALKAAGAKVAGDYPATHKPLECPFCGKTHKGSMGEFVFGKQVYRREAWPEGTKEKGKLSKVRPGDIIQFRHAKFARGGFGHHTAVVAGLEGTTINVYHQNVTPKQIVVQGAIHPEKLAEGWFVIYRPLPKRD